MVVLLSKFVVEVLDLVILLKSFIVEVLDLVFLLGYIVAKNLQLCIHICSQVLDLFLFFAVLVLKLSNLSC